MTEVFKEKILDGIDDKYLCEVIKYTEQANHHKKNVISLCGKVAACIVAVLGISFSSLFVATATGSMTAYKVLNQLFPAIAVKLMPVNVYSEDQGIRMEVEAISVEGDTAYVYISMQDLEGNRVDKSIDLFDSYSIHTDADQMGSCALVDYDEESRKATFLIQIQHLYQKPIKGSAMTFSVSKFLSGKEELEMELPQIDIASITENQKTREKDTLHIRGYAYESEKTPEHGTGKVLCTEDSKRFVPTQGVSITNYGMVDGTLHVQAHYDDIIHFDNHGYVYLIDESGSELLPGYTVSFWDEEHIGSYEEYVFDISEKDLEKYTAYGYFCTCKNLVEGDWKVRFTIDGKQ